jgi:hypothetical protein
MEDRGRLARWAVAGAALLVGGVAAYRLGWTTDDAFISFRYARNLVDGLGLVFNAGERVEGFSNLLWTLWAAVGLKLGFAAEVWSNAWGVVFYLGSIALFAWNHEEMRREMGIAGITIPLAACCAALHRDWSIWATSGLETSCFTFLLILGWLLLFRSELAAGAVVGLACLTRPEGVLVAVVCGVFLLVAAPSRWKAAASFLVPFLAIWGGSVAWRMSYYGDFFPNPYYAKSANLAWWSQGLRYLQLYAEKYWALFLAAAVLGALAARAGGLGAARRRVLLAAAIALVHTLYITRLGGDFMFARLLIPATPFLLVVLEALWLRALAGRTAIAMTTAGAILAAIVLTPAPVSATRLTHGILDEHGYYDAARAARTDAKAGILEPFLHDLDLPVVFYGDEARLVYRARFPVAIEGHTGLTDRTIARQPLRERGRPGHEKLGDFDYLIRERKAFVTFSGVPERKGLYDKIPQVKMRFGGGVYGVLLSYRPEIIAKLESRGAVVLGDFLADLDRYLARIDDVPRERVSREYERLRLFYFAWNVDPAREEIFRRRLAR